MNKTPGNTSSTARRGRKWLIYGLFALLLTAGLLAALIPTILSTPFGRGVLVGAINDTVRGSVAIDTLSLSWLGGQNIRGVEILDPTGKTVGRLEEVSTELTLLNALQRDLSLGRTTIRGLTAELIVDESGENNLAQALEPRQPSTAGSTPVLLPITGNIELTDARMTVTTSYAEPALFEDLSGTMRIKPVERAFDVGLQGRSRQADKTGEFKITGQVSDIFTPDGSLSLQTAKGNLEANVKDLPIDSVDGMLGLQGLLSAAAGESANLNIQASGTTQVQSLLITTDSPNIQAKIAAEINEDRLVLTQPASVQFNVTPNFFQALGKTDEGEAALRLVEAFPLKLEAERFDAFLTEFSLADVALRGSVEVNKPIQLTGGRELGEVAIRSLQVSVDSERVAEKINIKLDGEAVSQNKTGKFNIQATLDQLINPQGTLQLEKMRADAVANLTNVPTVLIDQIAHQNGQLVNLLGPNVDLSANVKSSGSDQIDSTLTVDAGPLKVKDITLSLTDSLVLTKPAEIRYLMSPEVLRRMVGEDVTLGLEQPTDLVLEVRSFSAPRPKPGEPVFQPAETNVESSLLSKRLALSGIPNLGTLLIDDMRLDLTAESLSSIQLSGSAQLSGAENELLAELNASPLQVRVDTATGLDTKGKPGPIDAQLQLSSEGVNSEINMSVTSDLSQATLTGPSSLQVVLTPDLLEKLGVTSPNQAALGKPMPVEISLTRLDLPLTAFSETGVQAKAALHFDELVLTGDKSVEGASLQNGDVVIDYDGPGGSATVELAANTIVPGTQKAGILKVDATAKRLVHNGEINLRTADVNVKANIDSLPTALLAAFSGQDALVPVVGDSMKVDMAVDLTGDKGSGVIELKTQSPNLAVDAGFNIGDELALNRPAKLRLMLTPRGYEALMAASSASSETGGTPSRYELTEDATFESVINALQWPLAAADTKTPFNPSRAALDATATTPRLSLRDRLSGHTFSIEQFEILLQGSDLSKPIDIKINGQIRDAQDDKGLPAAGRLGVSAQVADVFTANGQFNSDALSIQLDGQLQKIPTALLDQVFDMQGLMVAMFGATSDITLGTDLQRMIGPLNLQLRSASSTIDLKAQLLDEGLALIEPLVAEARVTQEIGKLVLGKIHPIFETAQSSEHAVRLEVPREGVLIPIRDYDISKVVIPRMELDLGKLTLKSGWLLKGTVDLAQQFGELKYSGRDQWSALFTPMILEMSEGKVTYERRLDLLLDERLHLATWGTTDIANDRVNLTLAFMPETLEKVFGLTVTPGDAFRIPVRGALSKPSVDFGKAGLELGRLKAQKRVAEKDQLVGAVVGMVTAKAIDSTPMPPASVDPLPWGPLPVPEGRVETQKTKETVEPSEPTAPKSIEEKAIEGLFDLLRKKKE